MRAEEMRGAERKGEERTRRGEERKGEQWRGGERRGLEMIREDSERRGAEEKTVQMPSPSLTSLDLASKLVKLGIQACQALASKLVKLANGAALRCSNAAPFVCRVSNMRGED